MASQYGSDAGRGVRGRGGRGGRRGDPGRDRRETPAERRQRELERREQEIQRSIMELEILRNSGWVPAEDSYAHYGPGPVRGPRPQQPPPLPYHSHHQVAHPFGFGEVAPVAPYHQHLQYYQPRQPQYPNQQQQQAWIPPPPPPPPPPPQQQQQGHRVRPPPQQQQQQHSRPPPAQRPQQEQQQQQHEQQEKTRDVVCGNCFMKGHALRTCMGPIINGYLRGCPICNTKRHAFQRCDRYRTLRHNEMMHYLVRSRGNRPPLEWTDDIRNLALYADGMKEPNSMHPWTFRFAQEHSEDWKRHVYRNRPRDEVTVPDPAWNNPLEVERQAAPEREHLTSTARAEMLARDRERRDRERSRSPVRNTGAKIRERSPIRPHDGEENIRASMEEERQDVGAEAGVETITLDDEEHEMEEGMGEDYRGFQLPEILVEEDEIYYAEEAIHHDDV